MCLFFTLSLLFVDPRAVGAPHKDSLTHLIDRFFFLICAYAVIAPSKSSSRFSVGAGGGGGGENAKERCPRLDFLKVNVAASPTFSRSASSRRASTTRNFGGGGGGGGGGGDGGNGSSNAKNASGSTRRSSSVTSVSASSGVGSGEARRVAARPPRERGPVLRCGVLERGRARVCCAASSCCASACSGYRAEMARAAASGVTNMPR